MWNRKKKYQKYITIKKYIYNKLNKFRIKKQLAKKNYTLFRKIIFTINIMLFFSNILLFSIKTQMTQQKAKKNLIPISFKNSEYFSLNFLNSTYQYISSYFHSKYNIDNKINLKEYNSSEKKVIKVMATGLFNRANHLRWSKKN